jgi:hypothetical protein
MVKYQEYKYHPRILELRVILYYTMLVRQYGVSKAVEFYKAICNITAVDWQKINGLINQMPKIRHLEKVNKKRFRQELVFMGLIYEESRYFISRYILNVSPATLYRKDAELNPEGFINSDWLSDLDNNVTICGIPQYGLEARRFIENFSTFMETLGNVSAPKV